MSQLTIWDIVKKNPDIPTMFDTNGGTAIPIANTLEILGDTVANSTYASPLFTTGSGNTVTANIQVGAAITGSPADKNDAGIVSFDDTMFTVDANGYVQLIGGSTGIDSITPDDGNVVFSDAAGNINYQAETVANSTYGKPLYTTGTPASNLITPNIQVSTAIASSPSDFNDAGIASFDSACFNVDIYGYVTAKQTITDTATANYIVDPIGYKAEYTTITAAIAAASAGDTIFIKEGTYTEDLTINKKLTLAAYGSATQVGNVVVDGQITTSANAILKGLIFDESAARGPTLTHSTASLVIDSCMFKSNTSGAIAISSGTVKCYKTGINSGKHFSVTGGTVQMFFCYLDSSSTASTYTAGTTAFYNSVLAGNHTLSGTAAVNWFNCYCSSTTVTTADTATINAYNTYFSNSNANFLTTSGTASNRIDHCNITAGTATAISIGSGTTVECYECSLFSSNTAVIDGAGTIIYAGLTFPSTSSTITTTTQTIRKEGPSRTIGSSNVGGTNALTVTNTDNTNTSSAAKAIISTGGASGGNPSINFNVSGTKNFSIGIDNSIATDPFAMSDNSQLSGGNRLFEWYSTTNNYQFGYGLNSNINELVIRNTGTTDAGAKLTASVGVSATGDPFLVTQIESVRSYCWGIDNSDSDTLKVNTTAASNVTPSGGTNLYFMTTSGDAGYSNGTGYLQIQKGTTAQRPGSPANGMIRYNTDLNTYEGYQSSGATWLDLAGGGGSSPLTTKGDIYTYDTGDARLAIGTDGQTLIADSAQATGNKWGVLQEVGGGTGQSSYTTGDLLYASASNTLSKLAVGTIPGDQLIVNDSGVVQWNTDVIVINDDFIFDLDQSTTNSNGGWEATRTATGDVTNLAGTAAHPGLIELSVAATSDDANMSRGQPTTGEIVLGGGYIRYDFLIKFDTLADVTDDYFAFIGLGDWTAFTSGVDYAGFLYDRSTSTNWIPQTSASSTTTTASGGSSVAVDTNWTHLSCIINAGGTQVDFYVDGTAAGSCTTNIPSTAITPQLQLTKTAGSNTRNLIVDAFRFYNKLTTTRWV